MTESKFNVCWEDQCQPNIRNIQPYQVGQSAHLINSQNPLVKLASNENLLGCSPRVLSVLKSFDFPAYYPDQMYDLALKIADYHHVNADQITLGNGSNDVLELIARCFAYDQDCEVIGSAYGFIVYQLATMAAGGRFIEVPDQNYGADLQRMLEAINKKTKLVLLANPNNPTGTWHQKEDLYLFLKQIPSSIVVVIDQAYFEYASGALGYQNATDYLGDFDNLVVTGSFSKAFGLAAMRVGYAISNLHIADLLNRIRQPFNINSIGLLCAQSALNDMLFIEKSRQLVCDGLKFFRHHFNRLNIRFIDSIANFMTIEVKDPQKLYQHFLKHGLIVRKLSPYKMNQHLRISIGLSKHQQQVIQALETYV